jgi:cellulose synthase/poly-beta-1,6-N-acetylglucosamine synthase-like glycosyltransferase
VAGLLVFFCWDFKVFYTVLTFLLCAWYGVVILFRLASVLLTVFRRLIGKPCEHFVTAEEVAALRPDDLPVYTVLVPMYKEPEIAQKIAHAVTSLDYPVEKLDVKLLLEEDDPTTRAKVAEVVDRLPKCVEVIVCPSVPKGEPRTKPRACNWGLEKAKGEYLVIYDAEDHPEPDQIKKAVVVYRKLAAAGKKDVICLQAKLNYFNARQNWLTRFFTLEYTGWFDLFLPGLHAFHTPIPLGGTSNHFQTEVLRQVGGWDPFNVTEDCDLGMRLARQGYRTQILDSTTWEEANSRVGNWVRQRSRWVKGYFQTHLVHTRDSYWPFFFLAAFFFLLTHLIEGTRSASLTPTFPAESVQPGLVLRLFVFLARAAGWFCVAGLAVSAALGLYTLGERLVQRARGTYREGRLNLYDAFTFRLTVGGMSAMLLLNLIFWVLTFLYLFHAPIANLLPDFIGQITFPDGTTLRDNLREWTLYYTQVRVEHFKGCTVWNTSWKWLVSGDLKWEAAREIYAAIDPWSFWSQLVYPVVIGLFLANIVFVLVGLAACGWRGLWDLLPQALLMPGYWVLISVGAYKGAWQLCWNPFYWEKTIHGLTEVAAPGAGTGPPPGPETALSAAASPEPPVVPAAALVQETGSDASEAPAPPADAAPSPKPAEESTPASAPEGQTPAPPAGGSTSSAEPSEDNPAPPAST